MAFIPALLPTILGAVATTAAGALLSPKPQAVAAPKQPTINEARMRADQNDVLSGRRGTGANRRVGFGAGEAATGAKKSLLGR
jgi:hypothetical protein